LADRQIEFTEGQEIGGGECDIVLDDSLVVELKVRGTTRDPLNTGAAYDWQARRYRIALSSRLAATLVAYIPADEDAVLPQPARVQVSLPDHRGGRPHIRFVVPYGHGVPSSAKAP